MWICCIVLDAGYLLFYKRKRKRKRKFDGYQGYVVYRLVLYAELGDVEGDVSVVERYCDI